MIRMRDISEIDMKNFFFSVSINCINLDKSTLIMIGISTSLDVVASLYPNSFPPFIRSRHSYRQTDVESKQKLSFTNT